MSHPRCGTCGDSTADAEFCIVPGCPHRGPATSRPSPSPSPSLPHPRAGAVPSRDARSPELGRRLGGSGLEFLALLLIELFTAPVPLIGMAAGVLGALYFALRDLDGGRTGISRRLTRSRLVDAETGAAPTVERALLRNAPMVACFLVAIIPGLEVFGWLGMLGLSAVDLLLVLTDPRGRRLGDRLAKTMLVRGDAG